MPKGIYEDLLRGKEGAFELIAQKVAILAAKHTKGVLLLTNQEDAELFTEQVLRSIFLNLTEMQHRLGEEGLDIIKNYPIREALNHDLIQKIMLQEGAELAKLCARTIDSYVQYTIAPRSPEIELWLTPPDTNSSLATERVLEAVSFARETLERQLQGNVDKSEKYKKKVRTQIGSLDRLLEEPTDTHILIIGRLKGKAEEDIDKSLRTAITYVLQNLATTQAVEHFPDLLMLRELRSPLTHPKPR